MTQLTIEPMPTGWIPVGERLPELGIPVLLWVEAVKHDEDDEGRPYSADVSEVSMGVCTERDGAKFLDDWMSGRGDCEDITHWMPMPSRPEKT